MLGIFQMFIGHLSLLFWEMSILFTCLFLDWAIYFISGALNVLVLYLFEILLIFLRDDWKKFQILYFTSLLIVSFAEQKFSIWYDLIFFYCCYFMCSWSFVLKIFAYMHTYEHTHIYYFKCFIYFIFAVGCFCFNV